MPLWFNAFRGFCGSLGKRVSQDLLRIYAFDHGDKSNGPVGLSGNGDCTHRVEYRTTGPEANNTRQDILINLDGYPQVGNRAQEWKKPDIYCL